MSCLCFENERQAVMLVPSFYSAATKHVCSSRTIHLLVILVASAKHEVSGHFYNMNDSSNPTNPALLSALTFNMTDRTRHPTILISPVKSKKGIMLLLEKCLYDSSHLHLHVPGVLCLLWEPLPPK
jgi:hypothetical protein